MKIACRGAAASPDRPGHVRLSAGVTYDSAQLQPESLWFEVPERFAADLNLSGDPWLIGLAPLAVTLRERLAIDRPVDARLLKNVRALMKVWSLWFPKLGPVAVEAESRAPAAAGSASAQKTCSFFSGGVDAFFTAVYHEQTHDADDRIAIDDLVHVWGFDLPLSDGEAYARIRASLEAAAGKLGKVFVPVRSNLRETQLKKCDWEELYHGPALAAVAHALSGRYRLGLIASSGGYLETFPQGSHVAIMPFLASSQVAIEQSGATFSRVEKIDWISRSEAAQDALHVCFHLKNEKNCGRCLKCYRTMLTLDLAGARDRFRTFDWSGYDPSRAARMFLWETDDVVHAQRICDYAQKKGRPEIASAMRASLRGTRRLKKMLAGLSRAKKIPGGGRLYGRLENRLLRGWVGGEERYYPAGAESPFFPCGSAKGGLCENCVL